MEISLATFKTLLHLLKGRDIPLKVKTHNGWSNDYLHIIGFIASVSDQRSKTFGGVVLSNKAETEGVMINNITTIVAFELQSAFEDFEPRKIYTLRDNTIKAIVID